MRRASTSISNNISEGCAYETPKAFRQYLRIALGSCFEVENLFVLIGKLYPEITAPNPELLNLIQAEQKMIIGLMKSLKRDEGRKQ
ncbi:four helix bundle protein [Cryomorpha ignava]|uniref:Four helix bundle protein n=1 Tax=Cryomorpha ignava TaxID=101383 RepID=A0A7K3WUE7_9FLAO|nr:four helix bundle protein [Cryomorpha ignava]NEN25303.1 four helix bundle protein [Cryomorpha ignava]